jgi:signal transduction histidine kinase
MSMEWELGEAEPAYRSDPTLDLVPADRTLVLAELSTAPSGGRQGGVLGLVELSHDLTHELDVLSLLLDLVVDAPLQSDAGVALREQLHALRATLQDAAQPAPPIAVDLVELTRGILARDGLFHGGVLEVEASGDCAVQGHRMLLRRALVNLIENARAATPHGHVRVRVRPEGQDVVLTVEDDGAGTYARAARVATNGSAPDRSAGRGLGLAIVRDVAEQHGGRVWRDASELGGLAVHVHLPRR